VCWSGHPGHPAIFFQKHLPDLVRWKFSQPCLDQRSDDSTAHFVQKTIGFDNECEQAPASLDFASAYGANRRCPFVSGRGSKRTEIVLAGD